MAACDCYILWWRCDGLTFVSESHKVLWLHFVSCLRSNYCVGDIPLQFHREEGESIFDKILTLWDRFYIFLSQLLWKGGRQTSTTEFSSLFAHIWFLICCVWQGRVISTNLFEIANTDLVPGKYEGIIPLMTHFYLIFNCIQLLLIYSLWSCGCVNSTGGLKLWECTIDLVETLNGEIKDGQLSFEGKHVLEVWIYVNKLLDLSIF
jgi:hypothetical protein